MNELTREWLQKAEGDFISGNTLFQMKIEATADAICFHCQQCAEKYTKAYLHNRGVPFPRTHNLAQLLSLCEEYDGTFATIWPEMRALNSYSADVRYPGRFTTLEEAEGAVHAMTTVRAFVRSRPGLDADILKTGE